MVKELQPSEQLPVKSRVQPGFGERAALSTEPKSLFVRSHHTPSLATRSRTALHKHYFDPPAADDGYLSVTNNVEDRYRFTVPIRRLDLNRHHLLASGTSTERQITIMLTLPALKVQQFSQEFYLLNLAAADVERLVRFEVLDDTGLRGKKARTRKGKSTPAVNWEIIEQKVQTNEKAFQRPIMRKKVEELAQYYLRCREDGEVPAIPGAVLLTIDEPVEFTPSGGNPFLGLVQLPEEEGRLRVLDGQHRLLALAALREDSVFGADGLQAARLMQVPAILFAGLPPANIVEMFVTINAKHTRLNPSLLVSLSGRQLFAQPRAAMIHDTLRKLNGAGSPLEGHIKMFGIGRGKVQLSSLAQEMGETLAELQRRLPQEIATIEKNAEKLFLNYFKEVAFAFGAAWQSKKHATRSTAALRAFLRVAPDVVERGLATGLNGRDAIREVIRPWAEVIGSERFEISGAWRAKLASSGKETVRLFAKELQTVLGGQK